VFLVERHSPGVGQSTPPSLQRFAICIGSSGSTCSTTAKNDRTADCRFRRPSREPPGIGVTVWSSESIDSGG
jgi:hypothetical protein